MGSPSMCPILSHKPWWPEKISLSVWPDYLRIAELWVQSLRTKHGHLDRNSFDSFMKTCTCPPAPIGSKEELI